MPTEQREVQQVRQVNDTWTLVTGIALIVMLGPVAAAAGRAGAAPAAVTVKPQPGSGPSEALQPDGQWSTLGQGEERWYAFTVPGEDKDGNAPVTEIEPLATPLNSARFAVWTPGCLCKWQTGAEDERELPVGRGSTEEVRGGPTVDRLTWAGDFNQAGTYYVRVMQDGPVPTNFKLNIVTR